MFVVRINEGEEFVEVCEDLELIKFFQTEYEAIDFASELNQQMDKKLSKLVDGDYSHINSPSAYVDAVTSQVLVYDKFNGVELAESYADVVIDFPEVEIHSTQKFYEIINISRIVCGHLNNAEIANRIVDEYGISEY